MIVADILIGAPDWILPTIGLVITAAFVVASSYRNIALDRWSWVLGLALKTIAFGLLAVCIVEPLYHGLRPRPGANLFLILADNSESMQIQSGTRIRGDSARELLESDAAWRTRLSQDFQVKELAFDSKLRNEDFSKLTFAGESSGLGAAMTSLQKRYDSRPIAGVLLFTDGNLTDAMPDRLAQFPIYPVVDSDSKVLKDIRIDSVSVTETQFETAPITVDVTIEAEGMDREKVTVRVVDGSQEVLASETTKLTPNSAQVRLRFRPSQPGVSFCRLEAFAENNKKEFENGQSGTEYTLMNNRRWININRGGGPYRILYVSGRPNWEFKYLRRALTEDVEIALAGLIRIAKMRPKFVFQDRGNVSQSSGLFEGFDRNEEETDSDDEPVFMRLGDLEEQELVAGFPQTPEDLFVFDAVIMDDVEAAFFTPDQQLLIQRFVSDRGGAIMMLGGTESFSDGGYERTTIGDLLPVYLDQKGTNTGSVRWQLTREGELQEWMRLRSSLAEEMALHDQLPELKTINQVGRLKPGASLYAASQDQTVSRPLLAVHRFGRGRVAAMLAGDLWRWRLSNPDPATENLQQYWRQIARWLVGDVPQPVQLEVRDANISRVKRLNVNVHDNAFNLVEAADVKLTLITPSGSEVVVSTSPDYKRPGNYTSDFYCKEEGPYLAKTEVKNPDGEILESVEAGWTVEPSASEFSRLRVNEQFLKEIADQSGGRLVRVDELNRFVNSLDLETVPVTESWTFPIWHQPWILSLALFCLLSEWGLKRFKGLP